VSATIDHLVVAAASLEEGVAWCERHLGITPAPGGEHPLMCTHNRLLALGGGAYLEIIALQPGATPTRATGHRRWFDLDDAELQACLHAQGPQLIHWVARVPDVDAACAALRALGLRRGPVIEASRPTAQGPLRWRITVRNDGQRLLDGALPTLIEWGDRHPCEHLPDQGLRLRHLRLRHSQAPLLRAALAALGLTGVAVDQGLPALQADLQGPTGPITLRSNP
jgi:hypothetical protein